MNLKKKILVNLIFILLMLIIASTNVQAASLFDNLTIRSTNVFTIQTLGASVEETFEINGITYTVTDAENNYVEVSGCDSMKTGSSITGTTSTFSSATSTVGSSL